MRQMTKPGWGAQLVGHEFDLADLEDFLRPPDDPWIERHDEQVVLRASYLNVLDSSEAVFAHATSLLEEINGAGAILNRTRPLSISGIIQFHENGSRGISLFVSAGHFESRSRVHGVGVAIGVDGRPLPPPAGPTKMQRWINAAQLDDLIADLLKFVAHSDDWFNIYKAIECLQSLAGSQRDLSKSGWGIASEIERMRRTANSYRHARPRPVADPMDLKTARAVLNDLTQKCLEELT